MQRITRRAALSLAPAVLLGAEAKTVVLHPLPANVLELFVNKTGALSGKRHRFIFKDYEVRIEQEQKVALTIQAASIVCTDTWVSPNDLKKVEKMARVDMLAVERFPLIRYQSTSIVMTAPESFRVSGILEIRDRTNPVDVMVQRTPGEYKGTARFRLTSFGLKPPSAALGLVGTKDEMNFSFMLARTAE